MSHPNTTTPKINTSTPNHHAATAPIQNETSLCRWDMRERRGVVQESPAASALGYAGGKDYARGANFTCMATRCAVAPAAVVFLITFTCVETPHPPPSFARAAGSSEAAFNTAHNHYNHNQYNQQSTLNHYQHNHYQQSQSTINHIPSSPAARATSSSAQRTAACASTTPRRSRRPRRRCDYVMVMIRPGGAGGARPALWGALYLCAAKRNQTAAGCGSNRTTSQVKPLNPKQHNKLNNQTKSARRSPGWASRSRRST